jgi:hypothetical protein
LAARIFPFPLLFANLVQGYSLDRDKKSAAVERTCSDDGVDLTLIRWMLSLTPAERLDVLQGFVDSVLEIRARNSEA